MSSPCKRKGEHFFFVFLSNVQNNLMTQGESGISRTVVANSISLSIVRDVPLSKVEE